MKLSLFAKAGSDKLEDTILRHLGSHVEIVRIGEASELVDIELVKLVLGVQVAALDPSSE